jgi:general secretion pathway protein N
VKWTVGSRAGGSKTDGAPAARRAWPWAVAGALLGALLATALQAPAAWLGGALDRATAGRLLLADARGTVWRGNARLVLGGGAGTRSLAALPERLSWSLSPSRQGITLTLAQPCCLPQPLQLQLRPVIGGWVLQLPAGALAQVPASWLAGLGAPWNTLQLRGTVRLGSPGLTVEQRGGRVSFSGRADVWLDALGSRLTSLDRLGDYQLVVEGQPQAAGSARLQLQTLRGPLLLEGTGQVGGAGPLRFRGQARAEAGHEGALDNVLNIMGRRQGPVSLLSIG